MTIHLPIRHNLATFPDVNTRRVFRWLVDGTPKDLTDWTGRLRIGQEGVFLIEPADAVTLGGTAGTISVDIDAGVLTEVGSYWYVVDLIDDNGGVTRFADGALNCQAVYR